MSSLFKFPGYILLIALFVLALPYIMPSLPSNVQDLFNNSMKVLDNTFKIFLPASDLAVSVAAEVSGAAAFATSGKNPLKWAL